MDFVPLALVRDWVCRLFQDRGVTAGVARSVANALVEAEADGLGGHGLARLTTYIGMVEAGKIDGKALPLLSRPRPATLAIDASNGFAYPALDLAVEALPPAAAASGIAAAAVFRSNHAGAIGRYVEQLAERGCVALFFANTPEAIAPWGGKKPVFGTNPIAFAAPRDGHEPIVVDMALSKVARGNIVAAQQQGRTIPADWAFDAAGQPTSDPKVALGGTMAPVGEAKGAALAFMVEVLAAALTGSHLAFEASSFLDAKGPPPGTGQFLIAIDPGAFGHNHFAASVARLAAAIEDQEGARLPGVRRHEKRATARSQGIVIPSAVINAYGKPSSG